MASLGAFWALLALQIVLSALRPVESESAFGRRPAISSNVNPESTFPWLSPSDNDLGIVNVASAPYNADPTGEKDSTRAIQSAIDDAREKQMVVYIPLGTYWISDTLNCSEHRRGRYFPTVIVGEVDRIKNPGDRPTLYVHDKTDGFTDAQVPKYVVHFWQDENLPSKSNSKGNSEPDYRSNVDFNQILQSVNVRIGAGNAGAIGVRLRGAQGCNIENVKVDLGADGLIGIVGASGSGGSHAGVAVLGGKYGLDFRMAQPAPTVTGAHLVNQTCSALIYSGLQTLTAVGVHVESRVARLAEDTLGHIASVPPEVLDPAAENPWMPAAGPCTLPTLYPDTQPSGPDVSGQISLIDSIIDSSSPAGVGVSVPRSLYMRNCYIKGPRTLVLFRRGSQKDHGDAISNPNSTGFAFVEELAYGVWPPETSRPYKHNTTMTLRYTSEVYKSGADLHDNITTIQHGSMPPPPDLASRHLWDELSFPGFQSPGGASVKASPYNAVGDGRHDDTPALQRAIDEHDVVVLPKGEYLVSATLRLRADTKLVGVGRTFSIIRAPREGLRGGEGEALPVIETFAGSGDTVLAFLMVVVFRDAPDTYALRWRTSGAGCVYRQLYCLAATVFPYYTAAAGSLEHVPTPGRRARGRAAGDASAAAVVANTTQPLVVISGGGKFYTLENEDWAGQAPAYRHVLVANSTGGLSFYQLNTEHSRGEANTEIRNSSNVQIFGLKSEGNYPVLWVRDSANVSLYGYGGNACAFPLDERYPPGYAQYPPSLFRVERVSNVRLVNLFDYARLRGGNQTYFAGEGFDPHMWVMVLDASTKLHTPFMERPVLYWLP